MERKTIRIEELRLNVFDFGWMLLTAGDFDAGKYNTMTVSWGMMGIFWGAPVVTVGVRPTRFTYEFMEDFDTFTLTAFPEQMKSALAFCGAKSGRDVDKIKECRLTPIRSESVDAPSFEEAELVIECRKSYGHQITSKNMYDKRLLRHYPERDFHKLYVGEVKTISAISQYRNEK